MLKKELEVAQLVVLMLPEHRRHHGWVVELLAHAHVLVSRGAFRNAEEGAPYSKLQNYLKFPEEAKLSLEAKILSAHPWFKGIEWNKLYQMKAAFIPEVNDELDTQNFEKFAETDNQVPSATKSGPWRKMLPSKDANFMGYTYLCPPQGDPLALPSFVQCICIYLTNEIHISNPCAIYWFPTTPCLNLLLLLHTVLLFLSARCASVGGYSVVVLLSGGSSRLLRTASHTVPLLPHCGRRLLRPGHGRGQVVRPPTRDVFGAPKASTQPVVPPPAPSSTSLYARTYVSGDNIQ
ncbi:UNVERIFIED_CONTAM: hypothetical protein Scaly_0986900 [Sesamum calycinum]|uniref:non-specific serine/threonine protein kinase n=1 Tax=Sesamum calycinum TaxID=2727403 RepID=A0AAW2R008_9LAMI